MNAQPRVSQNRPFRPPPGLAGGHRQTLLAHLLRRRLRWPHPAEDLIVDAGDGARLLLRVSWQLGPRESRPALVIVHGLGGSDSSSYVLSTGRLAFARGWHVVRMNMRGSGDGEALCPLLYNAGLDGDLLHALEAVSSLVPRLAVVGFSLGANLALLAVSRGRDRLPGSVEGLAAISPPLDLSTCADALERWDNRLYQRYFMVMLRDAYRWRHRQRPDLFPADLEAGLRTVREYDDRITAPFGGYEGAADYYARSSAGPHLTSISLPTLVLSAADDPMIPVHSVEPWATSKSVQREITPTGGHVGFVARASAPGYFWAPERALDFLESHGGQASY
ncbi:MAG: alpha/beta fold hydrolase [Acidobacteria bacterium]|nr:alpha/beta fold hydrolase [Acidobacteriota bacterium]